MDHAEAPRYQEEVNENASGVSLLLQNVRCDYLSCGICKARKATHEVDWQTKDRLLYGYFQYM